MGAAKAKWRQFTAHCFGCGYEWGARMLMKPGDLIPWLECPKCGAMEGAEWSVPMMMLDGAGVTRPNARRRRR